MPINRWMQVGLLLALAVIVAACGSSPKNKARDWASLFPAEIGGFEQQEDRLELTLENPSPNGHVTLIYENDDEVLAYLRVDVYATDTAADVEWSQRLTQWELSGVRFQDDRFDGVRVDFATLEGGFLAFAQSRDAIFSLQLIPPVDEEAEATEGASPPLLALPEEDITAFLETLGQAINSQE
jgi:hypothetical protein